MKGYSTVIVSILLGAAAVSIGMGLFLKKANDDRNRLADLVEQAKRDSQESREAQERAVKEANNRLDNANTEINKAQDIIKKLEVEKAQILASTPLREPSSKELKGWQEVVSIAQGVTMRYPPGNDIQTNDAAALIISKSKPNSNLWPTTDSRWFSCTPYDARLETELIRNFVTSTAVSYVVDGKLIIGHFGTIAASEEKIFVAIIKHNGQITNLIWMRDYSKNSEGFFTKILSTLKFAK